MKKIMFLLTLLCSSMTIKAQSDQMTAILQHGEETSVFKGASALINAHAAAEDGDVITLSDGIFTATNITKNVSIYGAGYETDEASGTTATEIVGDWAIATDSNKPLSDIHIEGVGIKNSLLPCRYASVERFTLNKCHVYGNISLSNTITGFIISQCIVDGGISGGNSIANNMLVSNSIIKQMDNYNKESTIKVDHCLVRDLTDADYDNIRAIWTNNVFTGSGGSSYYRNVRPYSKVSYCLCVKDSWGNNSSVDHITQVALADLFADGGDATYSATRTYELKQPETWIGSDGTQIGIHGGNGFSKVPATPVVKNLSVEVEGMTLKVSYDAVVR